MKSSSLSEHLSFFVKLLCGIGGIDSGRPVLAPPRAWPGFAGPEVNPSPLEHFVSLQVSDMTLLPIGFCVYYK